MRMSYERTVHFVAGFLLVLLLAESTANAAAGITGPNDGDVFSTTASIGVTGFIDDAVNTVYIKLKLQPGDEIEDSGSQVVQIDDPNDGASYGYFSVSLEPPPAGWPPGDYVIEVQEGDDDTVQDEVYITIGSQ